ncbi:L-fucose isomerase-like protein [Hydrogenispora ethanolica]|uniref:L-fucose isomerase-like protein n=1 Tax=Hydrogenispora ethanolica TaxID=1082276 RepID=A0A4R1R5R6_HYDET|nr:L-fucose/L-arabinose isomerase family protein [Hydrogenispora ethanolica]TCL60865.1 L-fucose isomerase-like protein [Hydrogenispora ethanolica]
MNKITLGVIISNRDFFPDHLVAEGRRDIVKLLAELDMDAVMLGEDQTKLGAVETWQDAKICAELFQKHRSRIAGILVILPNFGDERAVADTVKLSGLRVPILIQAYPDDLDRFNVEHRRDAFCGKISVCNNLRQYGYAFSLTQSHTVHPDSAEFKAELQKFAAVCRVVNGVRTARMGAIGARPAAFNTVRYSEKLLQANGISVNTLDLSEVLGATQRLADDHPQVKEFLNKIRDYTDTAAVPELPLLKMAKLGTVITDWMTANELHATAIQCWDSLQSNYAINVCALMSMMSKRLFPSACEVDVTGAVSMYALQLASGRPSALVDWNNNYADDPDKCVLFHCGNWAKSFFPATCMGWAEILGTTLGRENTYGTIVGRVASGPMSYARISTDDRHGTIRTYVGEGTYTADPLDTFGSRAVIAVPRLQELLRFICQNGFEHHTAMNPAHTAVILEEAFVTYFGWETYHHPDS